MSSSQGTGNGPINIIVQQVPGQPSDINISDGSKPAVANVNNVNNYIPAPPLSALTSAPSIHDRQVALAAGADTTDSLSQLSNQLLSLHYAIHKLQATVELCLAQQSLIQHYQPVQNYLLTPNQAPLPPNLGFNIGYCAANREPLQLVPMQPQMQPALPVISNLQHCFAPLQNINLNAAQPVIQQNLGVAGFCLLDYQNQQAKLRQQLQAHGPLPTLVAPTPVVFPLPQVMQSLYTMASTGAGQLNQPLAGYPIGASIWESYAKQQQQQEGFYYFAPTPQQAPIIDAAAVQQSVPKQSDLQAINQLMENWSRMLQYGGVPQPPASKQPVTEPTTQPSKKETASSDASTAVQSAQAGVATGSVGVQTAASVSTQRDNVQQQHTETQLNPSTGNNQGQGIQFFKPVQFTDAQVNEGSLGTAMALLKGVNAENARAKLDQLFNEQGQTLFVDNDLPVNYDTAKRFITLYKTAIEHEQKPNKPPTKEQVAKKQQRLEAIKHIEQLVERANSPEITSEKQTMLHRLALQLCGRVRERNLVKQEKLPFCGPFSVFQATWGKQPDKIAKVISELALNNEAKLDGGKSIAIPDEYDFTNQNESWADKILLAALVGEEKVRQGETGSNETDDISYLNKLGILATKHPKKSGDVHKALSGQDEREFLQTLITETQQKHPILARISSTFSQAIKDKIYQSQTPKQRKAIPLDIVIDSLKEPQSVDGKKHVVILEKVELDQDLIKFDNKQEINVKLKLHAWGQSYTVEVSQEDFFKHVDCDRLVVVGKAPEDDGKAEDIGPQFDRSMSSSVMAEHEKFKGKRTVSSREASPVRLKAALNGAKKAPKIPKTSLRTRVVSGLSSIGSLFRKKPDAVKAAGMAAKQEIKDAERTAKAESKLKSREAVMEAKIRATEKVRKEAAKNTEQAKQTAQQRSKAALLAEKQRRNAAEQAARRSVEAALAKQQAAAASAAANKANQVKTEVDKVVRKTENLTSSANGTNLQSLLQPTSQKNANKQPGTTARRVVQPQNNVSWWQRLLQLLGIRKQ